MADEAFALSPISARASLPSEADYDAIREAFMETSRGRWFLDEYGKRNRNADTRMVLDAVARIEAAVAAQKPAPAAGLLEAMGKIRSIVSGSKASATAAMASPISDEVLAAAREGARIIREIAWTLRECGADIRICDLLDTQVRAIDASQQQDGGSITQVAVLATFDLLMRQIEALAAAPSTGESPVEAAAPETAEAATFQETAQTAPAAETPTPPEAVAEMPADMSAASPNDDAGAAEQIHGGAEVERPTTTPIPPVMLSRLIVEDRSKALEDIAIIECDIPPEANDANENNVTTLAANDAASEFEVKDFASGEQAAGGLLAAESLETAELAIEDAISDDLATTSAATADLATTEPATAEFVAEDSEKAELIVGDPTHEDQTVNDVAAEDLTAGVLPTVDFAAGEPEAQDHEAEDMAVLDMVAQEMAEPDMAEPETAELGMAAPTDSPMEVAEAPVAAMDVPLEREMAVTVEIAEPVSSQTETPLAPEQPSESSPSLGAALIANGVLSKPTLPTADPLGPIKRMSQADKIAFFA